RCLCRRLCTASFDNDDWFATIYFSGCGEEGSSISYGFHVDDDALRLLVAAQIINEITPANINHRADGDKGAEANVFAHAPIQHRRTQGTALADKAYVAWSGHCVGKGSVEAS